MFVLDGCTPYEHMTGNTPDISEYTDYEWYQSFWYLDQEASFPDDKRKLAKWLCNLKESNPVEIAQYAITHNIADEVAFAW